MKPTKEEMKNLFTKETMVDKNVWDIVCDYYNRENEKFMYMHGTVTKKGLDDFIDKLLKEEHSIQRLKFKKFVKEIDFSDA